MSWENNQSYCLSMCSGQTFSLNTLSACTLFLHTFLKSKRGKSVTFIAKSELLLLNTNTE